MHSLTPKRIASPDGRFEARLAPVDGNPWDLTYASLSLAVLPFGSRLFGWHGVWSSCSRYFAIPEWRRSEFSIGPDMHLVVIDATAGRECVMDRAENGFVEPMSVCGNKIRYNKILYGRTERLVEERELREAAAWRELSDRPPDFF